MKLFASFIYLRHVRNYITRVPSAIYKIFLASAVADSNFYFWNWEDVTWELEDTQLCSRFVSPSVLCVRFIVRKDIYVWAVLYCLLFAWEKSGIWLIEKSSVPNASYKSNCIEVRLTYTKSAFWNRKRSIVHFYSKMTYAGVRIWFYTYYCL